MSHLSNSPSTSSNGVDSRRIPIHHELFKIAVKIWYPELYSANKNYELPANFQKFINDVHKILGIDPVDINRQLVKSMRMDEDILSENSPIKLPKKDRDIIHRLTTSSKSGESPQIPASQLSKPNQNDNGENHNFLHRPYKTAAQNLKSDNPYLVEPPKLPNIRKLGGNLEELELFNSVQNQTVNPIKVADQKQGENSKKLSEAGGNEDSHRQNLKSKKKGINEMNNLKHIKTDKTIAKFEAIIKYSSKISAENRSVKLENENMKDFIETSGKNDEDLNNHQKTSDELATAAAKIDDLEKRLKEKEEENKELNLAIQNLIVSDREAFKMVDKYYKQKMEEDKLMNSDRIDKLTEQIEKLIKSVEELKK